MQILQVRDRCFVCVLPAHVPAWQHCLPSKGKRGVDWQLELLNPAGVLWQYWLPPRIRRQLHCSVSRLHLCQLLSGLGIRILKGALCVCFPVAAACSLSEAA